MNDMTGHELARLARVRWFWGAERHRWLAVLTKLVTLSTKSVYFLTHMVIRVKSLLTFEATFPLLHLDTSPHQRDNDDQKARFSLFANIAGKRPSVVNITKNKYYIVSRQLTRWMVLLYNDKLYPINNNTYILFS